MIRYKSYSNYATGSLRNRSRGIFSQIKNVTAVAVAITALGLSVAPAKAASALWISAPNWSYSAAAASSPIGTAYFWGLSVGPGTYSWAYAFSVGGGGSAYSFAEAAAGRGGMGGVQVAGLADPYAGVGIDITLDDPSNPSGFPQSQPGTDPFSTSYTVSGTGITFTGSGSELNGDDELEAFVYNGNIDMASLEAELGASSDSGTTSSGDVTDFSTLESDFGLIPLLDPIDDPSSLSSLDFTENLGDIDPNFDNVILVGKQTADVTPEPSTASLLGIGMAGLLIFKKRREAVAA